MRQVFISVIYLLLLLPLDISGQTTLKGRMYQREGIPFSWLKFETDSDGVYYSVAEMAPTTLSKNGLYWKQLNDSTLKLSFDFWDKGDTILLFFDKNQDILRSKDGDIFHRMKILNYDGKTYQE